MEGLHHCETFLKGTEIWFQSKRRPRGFPSHLCIRDPWSMCFIKATFCPFSLSWEETYQTCYSERRKWFNSLDLRGKIRALSGADTCKHFRSLIICFQLEKHGLESTHKSVISSGSYFRWRRFIFHRYSADVGVSATEAPLPFTKCFFRRAFAEYKSLKMSPVK